MQTKMLEIRDRGTRIPVLAIKTTHDSDKEAQFFRSGGFGERTVIVLKVNPEIAAEYDSFKWGSSRTMTNAHYYIEHNWQDLKDGDVVDVEYILGESDVKKTSEVWV